MPDREAVTRRTVLSRGVTTTVAIGVGAAAFTGTGAAHSCPRTPGYWKNHDWPDTGVVGRINDRIDALDFGSEAEGRAFLAEPKRGDKGQIMAFHLIATILNYQYQGPIGLGHPEDPCLETEVIEVDGDLKTVDEVVRMAIDWLNASGWTRDTPVRTWIVDGADGEVLKDGLDDFNNNRLDLENCGCDGEERDAERGVSRGRSRRGHRR